METYEGEKKAQRIILTGTLGFQWRDKTILRSAGVGCLRELSITQISHRCGSRQHEPQNRSNTPPRGKHNNNENTKYKIMTVTPQLTRNWRPDVQDLSDVSRTTINHRGGGLDRRTRSILETDCNKNMWKGEAHITP